MDRGSEAYRRFREEGDEEGLAEIIRLYREGLIFYLAGILGDLSAAEEAAEDVFVRLGTKKPRDRGKSSFKTWLYAIGRNEARSAIRRKRAVLVPPEEIPELTDVYDSPELTCFAEEKNRALHRCLGRLKSEYHQVLWLYYFETLSAKEIAAVMDRSVHSVETLLYRARLAAKRELEKEGFDHEDL